MWFYSLDWILQTLFNIFWYCDHAYPGVCLKSLRTFGWFIWRTSTFRVFAPRPATYPASTSRALRHAKVRNWSLCKLPVLSLITSTVKKWGDCTWLTQYWTSREWQRTSSRDPKFQNLNWFGCLPGYQVNCIWFKECSEISQHQLPCVVHSISQRILNSFDTVFLRILYVCILKRQHVFK